MLPIEQLLKGPLHTYNAKRETRIVEDIGEIKITIRAEYVKEMARTMGKRHKRRVDLHPHPTSWTMGGEKTWTCELFLRQAVTCHDCAKAWTTTRSALFSSVCLSYAYLNNTLSRSLGVEIPETAGGHSDEQRKMGEIRQFYARHTSI